MVVSEWDDRDAIFKRVDEAINGVVNDDNIFERELVFKDLEIFYVYLLILAHGNLPTGLSVQSMVN